MEEMTLSKLHSSKVPYGYIRNADKDHSEVVPILNGG